MQNSEDKSFRQFLDEYGRSNLIYGVIGILFKLFIGLMIIWDTLFKFLNKKAICVGSRKFSSLTPGYHNYPGVDPIKYWIIFLSSLAIGLAILVWAGLSLYKIFKDFSKNTS